MIHGYVRNPKPYPVCELGLVFTQAGFLIGGFLFIPLHLETWFVLHLVSNSNFSFYLFLFVKLYQVWGGMLCSASWQILSGKAKFKN
jgi:hypothetical protein